jgi:hypothetical protein
MNTHDSHSGSRSVRTRGAARLRAVTDFAVELVGVDSRVVCVDRTFAHLARDDDKGRCGWRMLMLMADRTDVIQTNKHSISNFRSSVASCVVCRDVSRVRAH